MDEAVVDGGANRFFKKDFFWYSGSDTTPPCKEGVDRIVMTHGILIPHL